MHNREACAGVRAKQRSGRGTAVIVLVQAVVGAVVAAASAFIADAEAHVTVHDACSMHIRSFSAGSMPPRLPTPAVNSLCSISMSEGRTMCFR